MSNWAFQNSCYTLLSDMTQEIITRNLGPHIGHWPLVQKTISSTILSQFNLVHAHITYFNMISFDIILLSYFGIPSSHFSINF